MENASKALLMAAGVLIGILILSLAVFLFIDFGSKSRVLHKQIELNQLTQYNAQYTIYSGRNDITIYDIISVANLAKQNNDNYSDYTDFDNAYKIIVRFNDGDSYSNLNFQNEILSKKQELIDKHTKVNTNGELTSHFKCTRYNISFKWTY